MKLIQKNVQLILVIIGLLLIIVTYFYYPSTEESSMKESTKIDEPEENIDSDKDTAFENVEYTGIYDLDKTFTVRSDKAHIQNEEPDLVYMNNMHVILYLNDGRVVNITSDEGRYNKVSYDCFFEKNVLAEDGEIEIVAENLDLLATKNEVKVYNNVELKHPTGFLKADNINYDFETKDFKVSMFNDKKIKMKVVK